MSDISDACNGVPCEVSVERLVGNVDVERLDGTVEKDIPMYRKEKLANPDDLESVYEREYVGIKEGDVPEEIFLGNDRGETITIKERSI